MTIEELHALFKKHKDQYSRFDRIAAPFSRRPDLHAFILLDRLVPGTRDIVSAAEHDEIFLDVSVEDLAAVATEENIIDLIRCGVRWDSDSLAMFA